MFNATFALVLSGQISRQYRLPTPVEAGKRIAIEEPILSEATTEISFPLDVSETKLLAMQCSGDVTVKVNNSSEPEYSFTLAAGVPFVWAEPLGDLKDSDGSTVTVDFITLHIENLSEDPAVFLLDALVDPTP